MNQSEKITEIAGALANIQADLPHVKKSNTADIPTKSGKSYSYNYADLGSICDAVYPLLNENKLVLVQLPDTTGDGTPALTTTLIHAPTGEYFSATSPVVMADNTGQAQGSGITYLRRYALCAILGLVTEDDDGAAATTTAPATTRRAAPVRAHATPKVIEEPSGEPFIDPEQVAAVVEEVFDIVESPVEEIDERGNAGFPDDRGRLRADGPTGPQVKRLHALFRTSELPGTVEGYISKELGRKVTNPGLITWKEYNKVCEGLDG